MTPRRCLGPDDCAGLLTFAPPLPVPGFALPLARHVRSEGDAAVAHVSAVIQQALQTLPAASQG